MPAVAWSRLMPGVQVLLRLPAAAAACGLLQVVVSVVLEAAAVASPFSCSRSARMKHACASAKMSECASCMYTREKD